MVIAIDGYSSCGKSTIAKAVAEKLGFLYIDSGAMYRAITYYCIINGIIKNKIVDTKKLKNEIDTISINFIYVDGENRHLTYLNGEKVEDKIRDIEVSENVSIVSKIGFVREKMVYFQRQYSIEHSIVMDGRDIGTVVFPDADLKIFVTAEVEIRAKRRFDEMVKNGLKVNFDDIKRNISERDYLDKNREISPLRKAEDAILLDNSYLNRKEQLEWVMKKVDSIKST